TIAKLANGHADNLLTTAALAAACPVAVAPAMNNRMYLHPATQANLERLSQRGVTVIPPAEGELGSHGEYGIGRLPEPAQLLAVCEALLRSPTWSGVSVLVTAGGTREPTDDVLSALSARRRDGQFLVGFAAEHGDGAVDYGRGKLGRKRLDAVVVN